MAMDALGPERDDRLFEVECQRRALALVRAARVRDKEARAAALQVLMADMRMSPPDEEQDPAAAEVERRVWRTMLQLAVMCDELAERAMGADEVEAYLQRGFDFALRRERDAL
jgi:hypothetical protein